MPRPRKNLNCDTCPGLSNCFAHNTLSNKAIDLLDRKRRTQEIKRGEVIYRAGDDTRGMWLVCSGKVKTYYLNGEGKALITSVVKAGDVFGHSDFINRQAHAEFAEATETCIVALLDAQLVRELFEADKNFAMKLLRQLAEERAQAAERALNIAYKPARARVLDVLLEMDDSAADIDPASPHPIVVARRQELAERAGLTVETAVRMLKKMEQDGKLAIDGRRIHLRTVLRDARLAA